jgi:hypothetical protein
MRYNIYQGIFLLLYTILIARLLPIINHLTPLKYGLLAGLVLLLVTILNICLVISYTKSLKFYKKAEKENRIRSSSSHSPSSTEENYKGDIELFITVLSIIYSFAIGLTFISSLQ